MVNLTNTKAFVPGAPSGNVGPSHPPSVYDHLPLPGNVTVGKIDTDTLRGIIADAGIKIE